MSESSTPRRAIWDPSGGEGHPRRWSILGVLVVSLLVVVLDNTVLNIALPTIQRDLDASQSELVWAVDSYILSFAALLSAAVQHVPVGADLGHKFPFASRPAGRVPGLRLNGDSRHRRTKALARPSL